MLDFIKDVFLSKPKYERVITERSYDFLMTEGCLEAVCQCIEPDKQKGHEGIAYLYGRTDGYTTVAVGAIRPNAITTKGSFSVTSVEMARLVREIRSRGLQLISQLHTHPGQAYHSDGDVEGLKLVCDGYVSVVLPNYGALLPTLQGAVFYVYRRGQGFQELDAASIKIIPERLL